MLSYEIRWIQRFSNFKKATAQLSEFMEKKEAEHLIKTKYYKAIKDLNAKLEELL